MQATAASSTAPNHTTPRRPCGERWLVPGVFFAGFGAYVWFVIKPRLIYDAFGIYLPYPEFTMDWACWREAWSRVAGPLEYVAAFLSQWFSVPVLGALIVTAVAGLICLGTERLIRASGGIHSRFLSLLPALAVLILYQTYHHPLDALLALTLCLWLAVGYQTTTGGRKGSPHTPTRVPSPRYTKTPLPNPLPGVPGRGDFHRSVPATVLATLVASRVLKAAVFLVLCAGLYYVAGTVCLLFGLLVGTWYVCAGRRVIAGAGAVLVSALVPWLAVAWFFYMTAADVYSVAWPFGSGATSDMEAWPLNVLRGLFLLPWVLVLAGAFGGVLPRAVRECGQGVSCLGGRTWRVLAELVVLAVVVAAIHQFLRAPHREYRFAMVHFTHQQQWDHVLRAARQVPASSYDCFYRHLVNRALYQTGRLGDDLFSFSQDQAGLLLLARDVPHGAPRFWMLSETAWELGDVNLAEQWAFERLEAVGECPSALERLAMVCLAKDLRDPAAHADASLRDSVPVSERPDRGSSPGREAARVVLNRMQKNVIHGRRAKALLERLDEAPSADDPWWQEIERVRALRCTVDRVYQTDSEEAVLQALLQANPRNQMAFEYLMAFYLVSRRTDKLVANLHRLDEFGYPEMPRHYEEALLIHAHETAQPIDLPGRKIRPETIQRFQAFSDRVRRLQNQPRRALDVLAGDFGDSYFYYHTFGISGVGGRR